MDFTKINDYNLAFDQFLGKKYPDLLVDKSKITQEVTDEFNDMLLDVKSISQGLLSGVAKILPAGTQSLKLIMNVSHKKDKALYNVSGYNDQGYAILSYVSGWEKRLKDPKKLNITMEKRANTLENMLEDVGKLDGYGHAKLTGEDMKIIVRSIINDIRLFTS